MTAIDAVEAARQTLRDAAAEEDRQAAAQLARREERRHAWATAVMATGADEVTKLTAAEHAAERSFRAACADVTVDPRTGYLEWVSARAQVNLAKDREMQARSILGRAAGVDGAYTFSDTPSYSEAVDRAMAGEASTRFAELQTALQAEVNDLAR